MIHILNSFLQLFKVDLYIFLILIPYYGQYTIGDQSHSRVCINRSYSVGTPGTTCVFFKTILVKLIENDTKSN